MLSNESCLLEGLQSADKTKMHPKANKTHPLLLETEATLVSTNDTHRCIQRSINCISVTCSPHNAKTSIGWYQRTNRPISIIGKTTHNRLILIIGRLSEHLYTILLVFFGDGIHDMLWIHWRPCQPNLACTVADQLTNSTTSKVNIPINGSFHYDTKPKQQLLNITSRHKTKRNETEDCLDAFLRHPSGNGLGLSTAYWQWLMYKTSS